MENKRNNDIRDFKSNLRRRGMKATPQRVAVHEAMLKLGHASADMIAEEIAKAGTAKVTAASVYNTLSTLSLLGIYSRRLSSTNRMFFDVNTFEHIHVYDCENNSYRDLVDDDLLALVNSRLGHRRFRGYTVEGIDVQIVVRPTRKARK